MASQITILRIVRVTGFCVGNSPVTYEFPAKMDSNAEMFPFDDVIVRRSCHTHLGMRSEKILFLCQMYCGKCFHMMASLWLHPIENIYRITYSYHNYSVLVIGPNWILNGWMSPFAITCTFSSIWWTNSLGCRHHCLNGILCPIFYHSILLLQLRYSALIV